MVAYPAILPPVNTNAARAAGSEPLLDAEGEASWEAFHAAVHGLIAASCCGSGSAGARSAARLPGAGAFRRLGALRWRAGVPRRSPALPLVEGRYLLPDVCLLGEGGARQEHVDVELDGERIAALRPAGSPSNARVLEDCRGRHVSAALVDMHVHFPPDNVLRLTSLFMLQMLRFGVTVVRDAGDPDGTATPAALAWVLSGALPGPEIHYAYAFVNHPPARWANSFDYRDPSDASGVVAELVRLGATWVKSYENLDFRCVAALKEAATNAGLGVMGHVPTQLGHEEALLPDAQHLFGVAPPRSLRRDHVVDRAIDWDQVDEAREDVIRRASAAHGLALTPTLNLTPNLLELDRYEEARFGPASRVLPRLFTDIIWHPHHGLPAFRDLGARDFDRARAALEKKCRLVERLYHDGIDLRLGTDTQQPFVAPGLGIHQELDSFERSGLSRRQVFDLATRGAAQALGLTEVGVPRVGARAELLVSSRSPLDADWQPLRDIHAVVARGRLTRSADLDASIARELARFEGRFAGWCARWMASFAMNRLAKRFVA
jgi:hypothetical protein